MVRRRMVIAALVVAVAVALLSRKRTVGSDRATEPLAPTPEDPWTLVVDVRDAAGTPVAASVWVTNDRDDLIEMVEAQTAEEIRFEVAGRVAVRAMAGDLAPRFVDSIVAPAGTEKRVTMTLDPGLSITGEILEPEGTVRIRGGTIEVRAEPLDPPWTAQTGEGWDMDPYGGEAWTRYDRYQIVSDWSFEFANLPPGRYRLQACCSWVEYWAPEEPIVPAGSEGVEIRLVPRPDDADAGLTLRFLDATSGDPVTIARWELTQDGAERSWGGGTNEPGGHELRLPPGMKGTLYIEAEGYVPHEPIPIVAGRPGEETLVDCELVPDPGTWADLDLVLRDEEGFPVPDMVASRTWMDVAGDEEGLYKLRCPAGVWRIRADPEWEQVQRLVTFWVPYEEEIRFERGEHVRREWTIKQGGVILVRGDVERAPWLLVDGKREILDKRFDFHAQVLRSGIPDEPKPPEWLRVVPAGTHRVEARCRGRRTGIDVEARVGEVTVVTFPPER